MIGTFGREPAAWTVGIDWMLADTSISRSPTLVRIVYFVEWRVRAVLKSLVLGPRRGAAPVEAPRCR